MELRPPSYFALASLIDGPLHGYAIMRRARELSDGRVRLSTGTLYALLDRAIGEELVTAGERVRAGCAVSAAITRSQPAGRLALELETERMASAAGVVSARLRASARTAPA